MDATGWLAWIIVGGLCGWFASMVIKTDTELVLDIIVGIVGALLGGILFVTLSPPSPVVFSIWSLLVALLGAVALLGILRLFTFRSRSAR